MAAFDSGANEVRTFLSNADFDSAAFIEQQIADVELDEDVESKLLIVFDGLAQELSLFTEELEDEITQLSSDAHKWNESMLGEMDGHGEKLDGVRDAVNDVKTTFERASEGAVKIGDRLAVSEAERLRIQTGIELLTYINWYDKKDFGHQDLELLDLKALSNVAIPEELRIKNWSIISVTLHNLRRSLLDISSEHAQNATKNVLRISEIVEQRLLDLFLAKLDILMEDDEYSDPILLKDCRDLVESLHEFSSGSILHKRYIYAVIEKSMLVHVQFDNHEPNHKTTGTKLDDYYTEKEKGSIDYLSELFGSIGKLCNAQFSIIKNIFPKAIVPKITRILIQRIYNDPAFGIQGRVDTILQPKPPSPSLPLSDYLVTLATVREKLSALFLILLELCSHPDLQGMGREKAQSSYALGSGISAANDQYLHNQNEKELNTKSDAEVREFLEEQIMHVLSVYLIDYFDREIEYTKTQYSESLRRVFVGTSSNMIYAKDDSLPHLQIDRIKTIEELTQSVANDQYLNTTLSITLDTIMRMENIGQEDNKLSNHIKEIFILQLDFVVQGVLVPILQTCTNILTNLSTNRNNSSNVFPPMEYLNILSFVYSASNKLKKNFEDLFAKALKENNNMIVVSKDALRNSLKPVDQKAKESLQVWIMCACFHIEKLLFSMQVKGDYGNAFLQTTLADQGTSQACACVCDVMVNIASAVQSVKGTFGNLDLKEFFWGPFGRHFTGVLISHIRKLKITEDGAVVLLRDLDEYLNAMTQFESKENIDMIICLKEIASVFKVESDGVRKVVVEDLRHLDTNLILALLKARSDYAGIQRGKDHWTRSLASTYGFANWDHELPWEKLLSNPTRMSIFKNGRSSTTAGSSSSKALESYKQFGPATLRKTSKPISSLYLELARKKESEGEETEELPNENENGNGKLYSAVNIKNESFELSKTGLQDITNPDSFASAMTSRFASFAKPSTMPSRPDILSNSNNVDTPKRGGHNSTDLGSSLSFFSSRDEEHRTMTQPQRNDQTSSNGPSDQQSSTPMKDAAKNMWERAFTSSSSSKNTTNEQPTTNSSSMFGGFFQRKD